MCDYRCASMLLCVLCVSMLLVMSRADVTDVAGIMLLLTSCFKSRCLFWLECPRRKRVWF